MQFLILQLYLIRIFFILDPPTISSERQEISAVRRSSSGCILEHLNIIGAVDKLCAERRFGSVKLRRMYDFSFCLLFKI